MGPMGKKVQILTKMKSQQDTKTTKSVIKAASSVLQMEIIMKRAETVVSTMEAKSKTTREMKRLLTLLKSHIGNVTDFARQSASAGTWDLGRSGAKKMLVENGVVTNTNVMSERSMNRSMKNIQRLEKERLEKERLKKDKENIDPSRSRRSSARLSQTKKSSTKNKKRNEFKTVTSSSSGKRLKIPTSWPPPQANDEYTPREVLTFLDTKTPQGKMKAYVEPILKYGLILVQYKTVMYVRIIYHSS